MARTDFDSHRFAATLEDVTELAAQGLNLAAVAKRVGLTPDGLDKRLRTAHRQDLVNRLTTNRQGA